MKGSRLLPRLHWMLALLCVLSPGVLAERLDTTHRDSICHPSVEAEYIGRVPEGWKPKPGEDSPVVISPDGTDAAIIENAGSQVMIRGRGGASEKYSSIVLPRILSDGRLMYVAHDNKKGKLVIDDIDGPEFDSIKVVHFLYDSQIAYVGVNKTEGNGEEHTVVIEGFRPNPIAYSEIQTVSTSRDATRYAYAATSADNAEQVVVADGTEFSTGPLVDLDEIPRYPVLIRFSPDNKSLFYGVVDADTDTIELRKNHERSGGPYRSIDKFQLAEDSVLFAAKSADYAPDRPVYDVHHNGDLVAQWTARPAWEHDLRPLVLSPDGQRVAFVSCESQSEYVVFDGEEGLKYDSIRELAFTPDSKHVYYLAERRSGLGDNRINTFFVRDTEEFGPIPRASRRNTKIHVSSLGQVALIVSDEGESGDSLFIDGELVTSHRDIVDGTFAFSLDGSRYAYVADTGGGGGRGAETLELIISGEPAGMPVTRDLATGYPPLFSPTGQDVAYVSIERQGADGRRTRNHEEEVSVALGDHRFRSARAVTGLQFDPTGEHLAWWASRQGDAAQDRRGREAQDYTLVIEGHWIKDFKPLSPLAPTPVKDMIRATGSFTDSSRYVFLGVDSDGDLYRVTCDLSQQRIRVGEPIRDASGEILASPLLICPNGKSSHEKPTESDSERPRAPSDRSDP